MAYIPKIGGNTLARFPPQFPGEDISRISMAITPIEHVANNGTTEVVGHGTGFLWRAGGQVFLISARHVLSGRDPFSNEIMSKELYVPKTIRIRPSVSFESSMERLAPIDLRVQSEEIPLWYEDPQFHELRTDIAALPLRTPPPVGREYICLNEPDIFQETVSLVGSECSIVGYPSRNVTDLCTPIWRRGALASEPAAAIDNKPMFLVDAATSPGFSGSPVFRRHFGPVPIRQLDGSISVDLNRIITTSLVGVYGGRLSHSYYGGEVPFVFYANRIPKILRIQE